MTSRILLTGQCVGARTPIGGQDRPQLHEQVSDSIGPLGTRINRARTSEELLGADLRENVADRFAEDRVRDVVELRGLGIDDDNARAGTTCERDGAGDRIDLQGAADGQEHVRLGSGAQRGVYHLGHQLLAEGDGCALEDSAAVAARRILLTCAHAIERLLHRRGHAAFHADDLAHGAVHFDDPLPDISCK